VRVEGLEAQDQEQQLKAGKPQRCKTTQDMSSTYPNARRLMQVAFNQYVSQLMDGDPGMKCFGTGPSRHARLCTAKWTPLYRYSLQYRPKQHALYYRYCIVSSKV
jgi:hypothetical protein